MTLGPRELTPEEKAAGEKLVDDIVAQAKARLASKVTDDSEDPRIRRGVDEAPVPQNDAYLVLSAAERAKGWVRPYRDSYVHATCGVETKMGRELSETYARDPHFYGATYCVHCRMHRPVAEFTWSRDGKAVGS